MWRPTESPQEGPVSSFDAKESRALLGTIRCDAAKKERGKKQDSKPIQRIAALEETTDLRGEVTAGSEEADEALVAEALQLLANLGGDVGIVGM